MQEKYEIEQNHSNTSKKKKKLSQHTFLFRWLNINALTKIQASLLFNLPCALSFRHPTICALLNTHFLLVSKWATKSFSPVINRPWSTVTYIDGVHLVQLKIEGDIILDWREQRWGNYCCYDAVRCYSNKWHFGTIPAT